MSKKSCDPTAYRLENFWWHVWGSDRRHLSGKTLARLWQQIASGPTSVPLKTPQWPFDLASVSLHEAFLVAVLSQLTPNQISQTQSMYESNRPQLPSGDSNGNQQIEDEASSSKPPSQNLTPSSSRPAPAHPILKKPRGPSTSGPRPTARFADVPDSEDEAAQQSSGSQQSVSEASQPSDVIKKKPTSARPAPRTSSPSKLDRKPSTGKKFIASSTALKRRPVLPRRESSQSSTGSTVSDTNSRDGSASRQTTLHGTLVASPQEEILSRRQAGSGLSGHLEVPPASAKKLGKRVANNANVMKQSTTKSSQQPRVRNVMSAARTTSSPLARGENNRQSSPVQQERSETLQGDELLLFDEPPPTTSSNVTTAAPQNPLGIYDGATSLKASQSNTVTENHDIKHEEAGNVSSHRPAGNGKQRSSSIQSAAAPVMARSKSQEAKRMSTGPVSAATFKSPSVVGMSKFAVTGGFDFETPKARPADNDLPPLGADEPDIRRSSVLDSRFAPTQPSSSPAPPLGRSKSQLTLLLERDKARVGDKHKTGSSSNNSHHHGDGKGGNSKRPH